MSDRQSCSTVIGIGQNLAESCLAWVVAHETTEI